MIYVVIANGLFALRGLFGRFTAQLLYWPALVGLFIFSAYRLNVGCDWTGYYNQFRIAWSWSVDRSSPLAEPIWWFALRQISRSGASYPWVNVFSSAVFFAGVHVLGRKQPDRFAFLILLFPVLIINVAMSGDRQACAIGLICIALASLQSGRLVSFVLFTVAAAGFHTSAIVFLVLAPLATGQFTTARLAAAVALAVPGALTFWQTEAAQTSVERYVGTSVDAAGAIFRVGILVLTGLYFQFFLRRAWLKTSPSDYSVVVVGSLAMILLGLVVPISSVIADRYGYYMVPIQAMILSRILFLQTGRDNRIEAVLPYVGLSLVLAVWTYSSQLFHLCYVPYRTWVFGGP